MTGRGDRRHYNFHVLGGRSYRHFFSNVFVIRGLIVAGECLAPLPGRLGRVTSGQELQVHITLAALN